jgi:hypothetical protein
MGANTKPPRGNRLRSPSIGSVGSEGSNGNSIAEFFHVNIAAPDAAAEQML